jgi:hypothetical protein
MKLDKYDEQVPGKKTLAASLAPPSVNDVRASWRKNPGAYFGIRKRKQL